MESIAKFFEWITKLPIYILIGTLFVVFFTLLAFFTIPFMLVIWLCEPFNFKIFDFNTDDILKKKITEENDNIEEHQD